MSDEKHFLAVFLDFENLAIGFRGQQNNRFDIERVLARLVEKGTIVVKRAYADWGRFSTYAKALQESAFEMMQIPARRLSGKNSADMRLCVDVMDMCYSKSHIDTFVIVSGDSDFSPLVSKLRENGKTVIGLGMEASTSTLLRDNCDEFIYYEDLEAEVEDVMEDLPKKGDSKLQELYTLLLDSLKALRRENRDVLWASLIKETMKRKRPSFNEAYYGFKSFTALLEQAAADGVVTLESDANRRTHTVTAFGKEVSGGGGRRTTRRSASRRAERDDEEELEAKPRTRKKASTRSRSRRDDDLDDDRDDPPPRKKATRTRSGRRAADRDEDLDDAPPARKKRTSARKTTARTSKRASSR